MAGKYIFRQKNILAMCRYISADEICMFLTVCLSFQLLLSFRSGVYSKEMSLSAERDDKYSWSTYVFKQTWTR